uniref:UPF0114 protein RPE_0485 n=1 Tax=Rhodopseudomonas palustris (strain BisA53) TaxID=316055 RepID=Q07UE0_RHOP5
MTDEPATYKPNPRLKRVEGVFEKVLFNSRWLMAPFYLGLVVSLAVLLYRFGFELFHFIVHSPAAKESDIILGVLALIDLSLTGNLILIVVFSGYENFVSRIDPRGHPDWPEWMTKVDFSGLKQKLLASIVAISAIQVLKAFMNIESSFDAQKLGWLAGIHLVFVVSTVMIALSDRWGDHGGGKDDKAEH